MEAIDSIYDLDDTIVISNATKQAQMSEDPRPLNDDIIKRNMTSL